MKIIHCADLHLDSRMSANLTSEKASERKRELLNTYSLMIRYAAEHEVNAIIIAGDLFDTKNVSVTARNVVIQSIKNNPDILFYYLQGNHYADSFLSSMDAVPENLKTFGNQFTSYTVPGGIDTVVVTGIELDASNSNTIYSSLVLKADQFNIVVLHGQDSNYQAKDKTEVISIGDLRNKDIDYLALGHIHGYKRERLDARGIYCYSGCLEGRGFDEPGEHGFVLLDIDEENRTFQDTFIPFAGRSIEILETDVTGCMTTDEISEKIKKKIEESSCNSRSLVKIVLTGKVDVQCEKNIPYLVTEFSPDFYFLKIYDETKLAVDYNQFSLDESLKGEFVRIVCAAEDMDEFTRAAVIRYGIQALAGEEME